MNRVKQFSARIDKKLFGKNFSSMEGSILAGFTIGALSWIPMVVLPRYIKHTFDYLIFVIGYLTIVAIIFIINGKILASKQDEPSILLKITCVMLILLLVILVTYLYSFKILTSQISLWITVPMSVIISIFCVFVWSHSKKSIFKKKGLIINYNLTRLCKKISYFLWTASFFNE
jgi:hypothetical protein